MRAPLARKLKYNRDCPALDWGFDGGVLGREYWEGRLNKAFD